MDEVMQSSEKSSAQEFFLLELDEEQLSAVPIKYRAFLIAVSFATNEILCLMRLVLLTTNSVELCRSVPPVRDIATANAGFLTRVLTGKIVEFLELVSEFGAADRSSESALSCSLRSILKDLKPLRKGRVHKLAKTLRNELSHHLSFDGFLRRASVSGFGKTRIWLGEMEGNSLYFLGEDLTNIGLFGESGDAKEILEEWIYWGRDASRLISKVNSAIAILIFEEFIPDVQASEVRLLVADELFADVNSTPMPLLWLPFDAVVR